jgi:hypothetical protein
MESHPQASTLSASNALIKFFLELRIMLLHVFIIAGDDTILFMKPIDSFQRLRANVLKEISFSASSASDFCSLSF